MATPLKVFISYSHNENDRPLLDRLCGHLAPLVRAEKISVWEDSRITGGSDWDKTIKTQLAQADIVIFLVSSDYTASEYINREEVPFAMRRHEQGLCSIVPVLLRSCLFEEMPYARFEFIPKRPDTQRLLPVENWERPEDAFTAVVRRLNELIRKRTENSDSPSIQPPPQTSTPEHLILERQGFERELKLAMLKLNSLRSARILQTDPSAIFKVEMDIHELETIIADIKSRLAQ